MTCEELVAEMFVDTFRIKNIINNYIKDDPNTLTFLQFKKAIAHAYFVEEKRGEIYNLLSTMIKI